MMKAGPFDIDEQFAQILLSALPNKSGVSNADVVKRRFSGQDISRRPREWLEQIDFGERTQAAASEYEAVFEYVRNTVKPIRDTNRRERNARSDGGFSERPVQDYASVLQVEERSLLRS